MRKTLSKAVRFEVFKRDSFTCQYCGSHPPSVVLVVDHINPVANDGKNNLENLITACQPCNAGKGARLLSAVPVSLKAKMIAVKEAEEQIRGYNAIMQAKDDRVTQEAWQIAWVFVPKGEPISTDWFYSIQRFISNLGFFAVKAAAQAGAGRFFHDRDRAFRYFCGVCWNQIRKQQGNG